jgi:hypothetical protein
LLDLFAEQHHPLFSVGAAQQDLRTAGNLQRRLTVSQEFPQQGIVLRLQLNLAGFPTTHGLSPVSGG